MHMYVAFTSPGNVSSKRGDAPLLDNVIVEVGRMSHFRRGPNAKGTFRRTILLSKWEDNLVSLFKGFTPVESTMSGMMDFANDIDEMIDEE